MSFIFHCIGLWAKVMLGGAFIVLGIAIVTVIITMIAQLFDKNMKG
jgi:hypothetical protein